MIYGIGNDVVEIERIRKSIARHGHVFIARIFTQKEQAYCQKFQDPAPRFAARFSAKEAISKALGVGIGQELSWLDIEIINTPKGKPVVEFRGKAKEKFSHLDCLLSMSHSRRDAYAVAIMTQKN